MKVMIGFKYLFPTRMFIKVTAQIPIPGVLIGFEEAHTNGKRGKFATKGVTI